MSSVKEIVSKLTSKKLQTKTQKILLTLLKSKDKDGWVSSAVLRQFSANLSSLRDLRREQHGAFEIQTAKAKEIGKKTEGFYYRVVLSSKKDVEKVRAALTV